MLLPPIRSAAVLGAGVMGAQIAAHLANAGIPALLLDLTADMAREGLQRARGLKPDPFFTPEAASLVEVGGFDTDLARLAAVDLVVEAVIEQPGDQAGTARTRRRGPRRWDDCVLEHVRHSHCVARRRPERGLPPPLARHALLQSAAVSASRSRSFRRRRPIRRSSSACPASRMSVSAKGVVIAKDRPNFIANHIGLFSIVQVLKALESGEYTIEEIDAITGPALGRPKSATFRTMDIAGLDVISYVAANLQMSLPPILQSLVDRGWIGEKAGQGFYKRSGSEILVLDPATFTYRPKQPVQLPALEAARNIEDPSERVKALFLDQGKVGRFLRATLGPTLLHTADVASDIAYSIDDIDRAMQWGYGWELGPFEIWDAIGVREVLAAVQTASDAPAVPPSVQEMRGRRQEPVPARRPSAGRPGSADSQSGQGSRPCRSPQCRRKPRRSRRRRSRGRVPFEDEHDRRRHRARCSTPA